MSFFRRKLAIAIAMCVIISLTSGVSGFTAVTADRSTSVEIATQTNAYLSFAGSVNCETEIVTNEFPSELTDGQVIVAPQGGNLTFGFHDDMKEEFNHGEGNTFKIDEAPLESGDSLTIQIDSETTNTAHKVRVSVDASGPTVAVNTSTTVNIECN